MFKMSAICVIIFFISCLFLCGCSEEDDQITALEDEISLLQQENQDLQQKVSNNENSPKAIPLIKGVINVSAGNYYDCNFYMTSDMKSVYLRGLFEAVSGGDFYVCVFDDMNFQNWKQGGDSTTLYNSGKVVIGEVNLGITMPGNYHIVFTNTHSVFTEKNISADFWLQFI